MIFKAIPFPIPQPERRKLIIHGNLLIDAKAEDKKQARAELEALIACSDEANERRRAGVGLLLHRGADDLSACRGGLR